MIVAGIVPVLDCSQRSIERRPRVQDAVREWNQRCDDNCQAQTLAVLGLASNTTATLTPCLRASTQFGVLVSLRGKVIRWLGRSLR